jgi:2-oxoglutarate decarboxylase
MPDFGANEWLVDEMRERYLEDPDSVDEAWRELFADSEKTRGSGNGARKPAGAQPAARQEAQTPDTAKRPTSKPAPSDRPGPAPKPKTTTPTTSPAAATGSPATSAAAPTTTKEAPKPMAAKSVPSDRPVPKDPPQGDHGGDDSNEPQHVVLRGASARTVANMDDSLTVPTATSVRTVPVKLLIDNRIVINNHLARARGGKVSFTHIIGYALAKAIRAMPEMNTGFEMIDGKPNLVKPAHVNLGLAIDLAKPDGTRQLVVPSVKGTERLGFAQFWGAYEDIVRRARDNKLTVADFQGTSVSLTNPGTIGTNHSVPRLMRGQGCIIGVGAMEYPPEWQGASEETLARNAISKVMTLTSTYDHRASSCAACTGCCSARTVSTTRSSGRCASRTSRSGGPPTSRPHTTTRSASRRASSR